MEIYPQGSPILFLTSAMANWAFASLIALMRSHPLLVFLAFALIFFMKVEYTMVMVGPGLQPHDVGFDFTAMLHAWLACHPTWNSALAAVNTAFVMFQVVYVIWVCVVDGRKRPTVAALFMYTSRTFLGYATQLPIPQEFLGSGLDFPVGNTSFFLFFSGHVAGSVIISLDMRRMKCHRHAAIVEFVNLLQSLRLLATRGHYTIDIAIGAAAGWGCDFLAGKYEEIKMKSEGLEKECKDLRRNVPDITASENIQGPW